MSQVTQDRVELPASLRDGLDAFCRGLNDALRESVVSVVLYGSASRGEYTPPYSDVNVMVVLNHVTVAELDRAAAIIRQAEREFGLVVLLLSEHDLRSSADVFPIKFLDMQQHHRLLCGKDLLSDLPIAEDHLRLRCEQQIKNLLLRLRQAYLRRALHPEQLEATLTHAVSSLASSLRVLLRLKTGAAPADRHAVAKAAAAELGLAGKPIQDVLAIKAGTHKPEPAELKALFGAFMADVAKAADIVDRL